MKQIKLSISKIKLDPLNPRHDSSISSQKNITSHLLENEGIKPLARDISKNGLSPIDFIAVIDAEEEGKYIAVEGNRRICALTLLNKPHIHKDTKAYFQKLKESSDKIPKKVSAIHFDTRENANIWIDRRHLGEQNGVGTSNWSARQKTRANTRRNLPDLNALADSLLTYQTNIPQELTDNLLTTTTRHVSNPFLRNVLGIRSKSSHAEVKLDVPIEEFNHVLNVLLQDILVSDKLGSRRKTIDIEAFARKLIADGDAPTTRLKTQLILPKNINHDTNKFEDTNLLPDTGKDIHNSSTSSNGGSTDRNPNPKENGNISPERDSAHPDNRKNLIPYTFKADIEDTFLRRAFTELKDIAIDTYPLSCAMVCRIFLERTYELYYVAKELPGNYHSQVGKTHLMIEAIIKNIEQDTELLKNEKSSLKALKRVQSNINHPLSPSTLGAYAHGASYPLSTDLKREWDNISPIISYMLKK